MLSPISPMPPSRTGSPGTAAFSRSRIMMCDLLATDTDVISLWYLQVNTEELRRKLHCLSPEPFRQGYGGTALSLNALSLKPLSGDSPPAADGPTPSGPCGSARVRVRGSRPALRNKCDRGGERGRCRGRCGAV